MESPSERAKPEASDAIKAAEKSAEPADLDSAAIRCVSTRTRGLDGVICRANARFGSVVEEEAVAIVPPRGIGPRPRSTEGAGSSRLRRRVPAQRRISGAVLDITQTPTRYFSI